MVKIEKDYERVPAILQGKGVEETKRIQEAFEDGHTTFEFDNTIYGHSTVKGELIRIQHGKCCFCESKTVHISSGDVEHFRPKTAVQIEGEKGLQYPGYYWLAYDYSNLFFSCEKCNRSFKRNFFPLTREEDRCQSHTQDLGSEAPLLIHPEHDDPAEFISFREEVVFPIGGNPKGEKTIERTGLDRPDLANERADYLSLVKTIKKLAEMNGPEAEAARDQLESLCRADKNFSLMIRANFPEFAP